MRIIACIATIVALAAQGCGAGERVSNTDEGGDRGADAGAGGGGDDDPGETGTCAKMDILFVIDDSGSMVEEQDNLAANFDDLVAVLEQFTTDQGAALDYRIAITTSGRDVQYAIDPEIPAGFPFDPPPIAMDEQGDDGEFRMECGMTRRWIERTDGDVESAFSCVAQVGTGGPGLEMPLYAAELALSDRMADGTNTGFLRDDALLAVVLLSDEDDCSRPDDGFTVSSDSCDPEWPEQPAISHFTDFFDQLKGGRDRWATAVIAGPGPGQCSSSFGDAKEAKRLRRFVDETGENAVFSSICDGDLATALGDAISTFTAACASFPPIE